MTVDLFLDAVSHDRDIVFDVEQFPEDEPMFYINGQRVTRLEWATVYVTWADRLGHSGPGIEKCRAEISAALTNVM